MGLTVLPVLGHRPNQLGDGVLFTAGEEMNLGRELVGRLFGPRLPDPRRHLYDVDPQRLGYGYDVLVLGVASSVNHSRDRRGVEAGGFGECPE